MNTKLITISLLLILLSGCIDNEEISGKYVHETGAYITLEKDMTFFEQFRSGNTASGTYSIDEKSGNITLIYKPFGSFIVMEKVKNGYRNSKGGIYEKK